MIYYEPRHSTGTRRLIGRKGKRGVPAHEPDLLLTLLCTCCTPARWAA